MRAPGLPGELERDPGEVARDGYEDPRPFAYFAQFHEHARAHRPGWVYDASRVAITPWMPLMYRLRASRRENVPAVGAAIMAANHYSALDHFLVDCWLRRKLVFMAKSQLFDSWPLRFWLTGVGAFPVLRGRRDDRAFATAHAVLERGDLLMMYIEGGRSNSGRLGEPRPGVGRIALESGLPVVPVAIAGSEGVREWRRLRFPRTRVRYGRPLRFERVREPTRAQAASTAVFERIRALHEELADERRGRTS